MVVTALRPTVETLVMQLLVGTPLMCTVQAPHLPTPQPYFVPTSSRLSRSTHNNGVSEATSTVRDWPLTFSVYFMRNSWVTAGVCSRGRTSRRTLVNENEWSIPPPPKNL